jgi:hypothetical protein
MRIAWRQFGPGIADADDRFALELMIGNPLVLHPAAVHHAVLVVAAKPFGRAQRTVILQRAFFIDSHLWLPFEMIRAASLRTGTDASYKTESGTSPAAYQSSAAALQLFYLFLL